ncbi:XRE family transcriptional regulator [Streptococcus agalactiae]|uniref:XRE family transcriptional regulator n=1 Tax=Streptococcus agalactiae TaxID=1311 RepID=UPI001374C32C|nr:XRE family transcriptional regulator [Streptococcus agalactiae]KAF1247414.1 transcriptional regulator [Streptococcus agalactiae]HEN0625913.1 XRE family transcriptional regulator [Streptococcus agalactiae]
MSWLSKEAENEIKQEVAITVTTILENYTKPEPRLLGLITQADLKKELGIEYKTLARWEKNGLPRYQAPLEDTRKVFYRVSDVLAFLGVK